MSNNYWTRWLLPLLLLFCVPAGATDSFSAIASKGAINFAVYANFPPYSGLKNGVPYGVDVDLGRALAHKLGLAAEFHLFKADESVEDDLRNHIWKGHYLGGGISDAMLHVPWDPAFDKSIPQVKITRPYFRETIVVARDIARLPQLPTLQAFAHATIGVELASASDYYLLGAFNGLLRNQVRHFKSLREATASLKNHKVAAVMGTLGGIESGLGNDRNGFAISRIPTPGLDISGWDLGVAVKANNRHLYAALNKAMGQLLADGTVAAIFHKHGLTYTPIAVISRNADANKP